MSGSRSMRTPLGRVRNLGSSHSGTTDFWRQRLTAVAMALLIVPVIVIVLMLIGRNHAGAAQILGSIPIATHEDRHADRDRGLRAQRDGEARQRHGQQLLLHRGGAFVDLRDPQIVVGSIAHGR
jgi:hypothetical protein